MAKIPETEFGQWNMGRREARINKLQSSVDLLDEKVNYVRANIAQHQAALAYHQSKGFFRKLFTFAWFSIWWNNRKLKKFQRKSNEWAAHKQMMVAKQMIAQRKFEKKYGREAMFGNSGRTVARINEEGKVENRATLGRASEQRKIEREEINAKKLNKNGYLTQPSRLPALDMFTKDGKFMGHYDHYNSIDNTVELDVSAPIMRGVFEPGRGLVMYHDKKIELHLNKNGELDLSLPENAGVVKSTDTLKEVLKQYPEAYKTIPANYFGAGVDRKTALEAVRDGVNNKIASARTDKDGNIIVDSPLKDGSGAYTGRNCSPREFAQSIYSDVLDKDDELKAEGRMKDNATERRRAANMDAQRNANASRKGAGKAEVDKFFNEATK